MDGLKPGIQLLFNLFLKDRVAPPGWLQTHYIAENDLEHLSDPSPPLCLDDRGARSH